MPMVYLHYRPRLVPGSWQNEGLIYSFHDSIKTTLLNKLTLVLLIFLLLPLQSQRQPPAEVTCLHGAIFKLLLLYMKL